MSLLKQPDACIFWTCDGAIYRVGAARSKVLTCLCPGLIRYFRTKHPNRPTIAEKGNPYSPDGSDLTSFRGIRFARPNHHPLPRRHEPCRTIQSLPNRRAQRHRLKRRPNRGIFQQLRVGMHLLDLQPAKAKSEVQLRHDLPPNRRRNHLPFRLVNDRMRDVQANPDIPDIVGMLGKECFLHMCAQGLQPRSICRQRRVGRPAFKGDLVAPSQGEQVSEFWICGRGGGSRYADGGGGRPCRGWRL
jgi:hypothetical protein